MLPFPSPIPESENEVAQSCPTLSDPMDCSLPGSHESISKNKSLFVQQIGLLEKKFADLYLCHFYHKSCQEFLVRIV